MVISEDLLLSSWIKNQMLSKTSVTTTPQHRYYPAPREMAYLGAKIKPLHKQEIVALESNLSSINKIKISMGNLVLEIWKMLCACRYTSCCPLQKCEKFEGVRGCSYLPPPGFYFSAPSTVSRVVRQHRAQMLDVQFRLSFTSKVRSNWWMRVCDGWLVPINAKRRPNYTQPPHKSKPQRQRCMHFIRWAMNSNWLAFPLFWWNSEGASDQDPSLQTSGLELCSQLPRLFQLRGGRVCHQRTPIRGTRARR